MIKNIFFDLDDTLFDFHAAEKVALAKTLEKLGIEPFFEILSRYSEINLSQWKLLEQGKIARERLKIRRYELLFDEFGICASAKAAAEYYESFLSEEHIFIDGAEDILKILYGKYRLFVVSNGIARVQNSRLESSGIKKYFNEIFISQNIGFNKPDKSFFDVCFSQIPDFSKNESVIVGDSLTSDIAGGKNAGIATVWFNPEKFLNETEIIPDFEVHSLSEISLLIKSL